MLKTYISLVSLQIIGFLLSACFVFLVSKGIPAEVFGQYSLALSIAQTVAIVGLGWTNAALLRYAREEYTKHGTLGRTLGARLAIHAVLVALLFSILTVYSAQVSGWIGTDRSVMPLLLTWILMISLADMGSYAGQAVNRYSGYGSALVVVKAAQLCAAALITMGLYEGWRPLVLGGIVGYGLASIISWRQVPIDLLRGIKLDWSKIKLILIYSWSVPFGSLGGVMVAWMDMWFINHYLDVRKVGVYSWAYYIIVLASSLLVPLSAVLAPRMIDLRVARDSRAIDSYIRQSMGLFFLAASTMPLMMAIVVGVFSIVELGEYGSAKAPILLFLATSVFMGMGHLLGPMLSAYEGLVAYVTLSSVSVAIINAIGDWLLVPQLDMLGAALATAMAIAFGMLTKLMIAYRYCEVKKPSLILYPIIYGVMLVCLAGSAALVEPISAIFLCGFGTCVLLLLARKLGLLGGLWEITERLSLRFPRLASSGVSEFLYWLARKD